VSSTTDTDVTETGLGPHPVFDTLLSWQPEAGYLRSLFGLGHLDDLALEPDVVLDPPRLIAHARLISATPTGSLALDLGPARSLTMAEALERFREQTHLEGVGAERAPVGQ